MHEDFEEKQLPPGHARRVESVYVNRAQFHVGNAAPLQCVGGFLETLQRLLGAHGAVIFVFNLQDIGIQLAVFAIDFDANLAVFGARGGNGVAQAADVGFQRVVANFYAGFAFLAVGVADIAHAQRCAKGFVQGVLVEYFHAVGNGSAAKEAFADGGGGAEQVNDQPAVALQVAHQCHVLRIAEGAQLTAVALHRLPRLPEGFVNGVVEMDTGDHLHGFAVTVRQPLAVNMLHAPRVGAAVFGNADVAFAVKDAGHTGRPQQFVTELLVDEGFDIDAGNQGLGRHVPAAG